MSDNIIDEINQDIAEERYQQIFLKHGGKLIIAGIVIIAITTAYSINKHYAQRKSREVGSKFSAAFENTDPQAYDAVISANQKAYSPLAIIMKAGLQNVKNDIDGAQKTLEPLASGSKYDRAFRELAKIDEAYLLIEKKGDAGEITKLLDEASAANAVFRPTALELKASYLLSAGKDKEAKEIYTTLSKDEEIPLTIQDRAKQALSSMSN